MSSLSASLIDLSGLPTEVRERVQWEIGAARRRQARKQKWQHLCDNGTEAEIMEALGEDYSGQTVPAVLASTYDRVEPSQELVADAVLYHPRRPVAMRGAKWVRVARHSRNKSNSSANGWASLVVERYLRMARVTAFSNEELSVALEGILSELRSRYYLTYHFYKMMPCLAHFVPLVGRIDCYIGGKRVSLTQSEYANIKALRNIIFKSEKLEERMKEAKAFMQERLAA